MKNKFLGIIVIGSLALTIACTKNKKSAKAKPDSAEAVAFIKASDSSLNGTWAIACTETKFEFGNPQSDGWIKYEYTFSDSNKITIHKFTSSTLERCKNNQAEETELAEGTFSIDKNSILRKNIIGSSICDGELLVANLNITLGNHFTKSFKTKMTKLLAIDSEAALTGNPALIILDVPSSQTVSNDDLSDAENSATESNIKVLSITDSNIAVRK